MVTNLHAVTCSSRSQAPDLRQIRGYFDVDLVSAEGLGRPHTVVDLGIGVVGFECKRLERVNRYAGVIIKPSQSFEALHRGLSTQAGQPLFVFGVGGHYFIVLVLLRRRQRRLTGFAAMLNLR